jgi:ABC-type transport system involved in cytochrome bd biosynthesis fused ATPase/permease subunit
MMRQTPGLLLAISCAGQALIVIGVSLFDWRAGLVVLGTLIAIWATFLVDVDRNRQPK